MLLFLGGSFKMSATPFRVGMIGYGLSAKVFHIPFIQAEPSFKLQAIVQRSPKPDNDASKDFPDATIHSSTDDLFKDADVDVVIVGTPPTTHLALAKQALESGKHVVVEKPFTPTAAEAQELVDTAKRVGKVLAVYQNRRWDVDFLTLKDLLEKTTFGRIVDFETHFDRWSPGAKQGWKAETGPGHGVVYDLGTHLMDQLIVLFGMPKKITAFLYGQRQPNPSGYEDSCKILLHYDGFIATAQGAVVSPELRQLRYWIRGDKGSYTKVCYPRREAGVSSRSLIISTVLRRPSGEAAAGRHQSGQRQVRVSAAGPVWDPTAGR